MSKVTIVETKEIELDIKLIARWFSNLNDEEQADFFVQVAEIAKTWPNSYQQWWYVGRHLKTCMCSTPEAQELIRNLAMGLE